MLGFTYKGKHTSEFNIGTRSVNRTVLARKRSNSITIPGRHGTINFDGETYEEKPIRVLLGFVNEETFEELRESVREVAYWLGGEGGVLIFDDEPTKVYYATVKEQVDLEQLKLLPMGATEVTFLCQPFAESLDYKLEQVASITTSPYTLEIEVEGTGEDICPIITIVNNGATVINKITITRKAVI